MPRAYSEMDSAGWFEAWLGGQWDTFDPGNNRLRFGWVLIARSRAAAEGPTNNTSGPNIFQCFKVRTDEVVELPNACPRSC